MPVQPQKKASVFVASSSEATDIAYALHDNMEDFCDVTVWKYDIFSLTKTNIETLLSATREFDFAALVLSPDDEVTSRNDSKKAPRDNILFEAGMFIGALGPERVFLVQPSGVDLKLPTDLAGVSIGNYRSDGIAGRLIAATAPVARKISKRILELGPRSRPKQDAEFCAAVCYRLRDGVIEYRLVKTSKGRWIFPKGLVLPSESPDLAAARYAEDEGGIVGRIEIRTKETFAYLKEDRGIEQFIEAHLVRATGDHQPADDFRKPTWFEMEEAMVALTEGRPARYAEELRKVIHWSRQQIENVNTALQRLAGALPYRFNQDGSMEFLLITSRKSGNWLIPKGHIDPDETALDAAKREAQEEAGIEGEIRASPIGNYIFRRDSIEYSVDVYGMLVTREEGDWKDEQERERRWFGRAEAAEIVNERGLRRIIEVYSG